MQNRVEKIMKVIESNNLDAVALIEAKEVFLPVGLYPIIFTILFIFS